MSIKKINAVFLKQVGDTLKNRAVLMQFVMMPALTVIMEKCIDIGDMPEHSFVTMFSSMFIGMAPMICMSSIIAEEKEKNTLRVLMMSGVKPAEYLIGVGAYVFTMCMASTTVFAVLGEYTGSQLAAFYGIMAAGAILSALTGAVFGVFSRNQMAATSTALPVALAVSLLPMLSNFNETIRKAAQIAYSQQINELIKGIGISELTAKPALIIVLNFAAAAILFAFAYRRRGLE